MRKEEALKVFTEEAFLIGSADAIPLQAVADLLGEAAAVFPKTDGTEGNIYGLGGDRQYKYLTLKGFMKAVTYHNLTIYSEVLKEMEQEQ